MATKRVRIAVAIEPNGHYSAAGWNQANGEPFPDRDFEEHVIECLDTMQYKVYFIEADIPIPESQTIQGEVSERSTTH